MTGNSHKSHLFMAGIGLCLLTAGAMAQTAHFPPSVRLDASNRIAIGNGVLSAVILPPGEKAFYNGTRFDQSGVVASLKYGTQEYYGPWFDFIRPDVRDLTIAPEGVMVGDNSGTIGPAEEYTPIGYDEAAPGGRFLQIGVGVVTRPDDRPFDRFRLYPIADKGRWRTTSTPGSVTSEHAASHGDYGYVYEKTVSLVPGRPQMVIAHRLRNTGRKPLVSSMYNHNFLTIDPGNANMAVTLSFPATAAKPPQRLALEGNSVRWPQALVERESASVLLHDESKPPQPYDVKVESVKTGAGFRVTSDAPITRFNLWSIRTVMAAEPYNAVNVAPGAEQRWSYTYTFTPPRP
jgi:hypothetical protein